MPVFFYNHLYQPSAFRNLFLKSGITIFGSLTTKTKISEIRVDPCPIYN